MTETNEITELEAAHAANGKLLAELEQLRNRLANANAARRDTENAYYEQKRRVSELEGRGAEDKLKALAGQIESEQQRLDALVQRKESVRASLDSLSDLSETFMRQAIEITDGIG